ncbi:MAG: nicotinate phosphoribosyltransferase [Pseudonocardiales bacterium]|nr:nicotinate phosphoribosyltransferase [Pseudonocardiales bacterium]
MTTALLTDRYELTMLVSALRDGTARRQCVFELFARRLPEGRRYGVVAGTARLIDAIAEFTFDAEAIDHVRSTDVINDQTAQFLATYRFAGDIDGYPEGELYFPQSPVLTVTGTFAEAVVLETLALSVLNHDCAVASAGARMVTAAAGRPIIEMGSRRTHERAAVAAARSAYLAGFASTSNLEASRRYGVPTAGTAAHSFTLLHNDERAAFAAQVDAFGPSTTLLVDTYDITRGIELAVEVAGPSLGAIRIDSGDLGVLAKHARAELDRLGATGTRIVLSGDLDEYSIASLAAAPVDAYGAGTAVVTGSGAPTAGMVYKLVEVDGRPVAKRSEHKESHGGRKTALRAYKPTGTAIEEIVTSERDVEPSEGERLLQRAFVRAGSPVPAGPTLEQSRDHLRDATITLPWDGLKLSKGEPAIPTRIVPAS